MSEKAPPETVEIAYREPAGLIGNYANGVIVTGPFADGSLQLTFYADIAFPQPQTGKLKRIDPADGMPEYEMPNLESKALREVRARISVSTPTAKSMLEILKARFEPKAEGDGSSPAA